MSTYRQGMRGLQRIGRVTLLSFVCQSFLCSLLLAEKAPLSPEALVDESDLVVVGEVVDLRIRSERSHIEQGFGNYDWAIYVTIEFTDVEKGVLEDSDTILARCFRIKTRKSLTEYLTPSGNRPIPGVGTTVRAHLYADKDDGSWRVVFPNGLASTSGEARLSDADAVQKLSSGGFTFLLPIELWIVFLVIGIPIAIIFVLVIVFVRRRRSRHLLTGD